MSAGQIVSVDQRLRIPVALVVLARRSRIGAVAGATIPSIVSGTSHAAPVVATTPWLPATLSGTRHELGRLRGLVRRRRRAGVAVRASAAPT